jgi:hypothetical protein
MVCLANGVFAQETTGSLEGRVVDETGLAIPSVAVVVTGSSLQAQRETASTREGLFRFLELPAGVYEVVLRHPDFLELKLQQVVIRLGRTTALGELKLAVKGYQENIVVLARPPLIDPTTTATGANLASGEYAELPIERDYRSVAALLPQASGSFLGDGLNFGGSTGLENRYFIDGIDVTDPNRNVTGMRLPYNFVQEVQVRTGGYEAEYRSALGGVMNAVTYSGSNKTSGQLFAFFLNNRFTAEPRVGALEPSRGNFASYDGGFGLGGPIRKDRLWYFAAYAPAVEHEEVEIPGLGYAEDRATTHSFAGKLTWRASNRHTLVFTAIGDPTERSGVGNLVWSAFAVPVSLANPDPYLEQIRSGGVGLLLEGRHVVRDNLLVRASFSRTTQSDDNLPLTQRGRDELLFIDTETGTWSGGALDRIRSRSGVTIVGVTGTLGVAEHLVKAGLEYKGNRWDFDTANRMVARLADDSYIRIEGVSEGHVSVRAPAAFLQDSWRLSERVRINAGLRWDGQYIVSSDGRVAQSILDQWQPRVGFIWQPGEGDTHKISASYSRFYQEIPTYPLSFYYNDRSRFENVLYDHDPRVDPSGGEVQAAIGGTIQAKVPGMEGQHFDEFTLGYERRVGSRAKIGLRGLYRTLRQALEDGTEPATLEWQFGNPGRGLLKAYPRAMRNYSALELSYARTEERMSVLASYVLSRTYGNYSGVFDSDVASAVPNCNPSFDVLELLDRGEGLLPNDRTHVLKLSGRYDLGRGATVGAVALWESGTPLNDFGASRFGWPVVSFLRQRGTAGRTPTIWDLNLRVGYEPRFAAAWRWRPRLTVDVFHVASRRQAVNYDQVHYFAVDAEGNQTTPNPTYGLPTRYQPPMAVRLGVEVSF